MSIMNMTLKESVFEICLDALKNMQRSEDLIIFFTVEHNDVVIGESPPISIAAGSPESEYKDVDFTVRFYVDTGERANLDLLIATPVLVRMKSYTSSEKEASNQSQKQVNKKKSKFTAKMSTDAPLKILYECSIDLMPLFLGEKFFCEKLIMESYQFTFDESSVSWMNLPVLAITVKKDEPNIFEYDETVNFLHITVESIYNPLPYITDACECNATTVLPVDAETLGLLTFEGGRWAKYRDIDRRKRYQSLWHLESRANLSKYKLDCDYDGIKNSFGKEFNLKKRICEDEPRIEWNAMHRYFLPPSRAMTLQNHITKYSYWPFFFIVSDKMTDAGKGKSRDSRHATSATYQSYVDLSELLYPGKTKTRVLTQLYTYNMIELMEKTGVQRSIFETIVSGKEAKDKEKKARSSLKSSTGERLGSQADYSFELISQNGEPIFVIVEVELLRPLIESHVVEDYSQFLNEMPPPPKDKEPYPYSGDLANDKYAYCIRKAVEVLTESYRNYCDDKTPITNTVTIMSKSGAQAKKKYCYAPESDELTCFTQFIHRSGAHQHVRGILKESVSFLLDQKFRMAYNSLCTSESQNFIASAYTYLVEEMHMVLNQVVEGRSACKLKRILPKTLDFYAEEAYEMRYLNCTKEYYLRAITVNRSNPDAWLKFAVFLVKTNDLERASEACLEAILLDTRHKFALILYGELLRQRKCIHEAEIFLRALTDFYPRAVECWTILHLFYISIDYFAGIELTMRIAEKCLKDKGCSMEFLTEEPIAWSTVHCPTDNSYIMSAVLLLKLHLCDLATVALAQEMNNSGRTMNVVYYLAVEHYLSGRYEDALSHLKEIECSYGMDYSISSLMGHCYFHNGDMEKAMRCYDFISTVFNRPYDIHLEQLRRGYHYINGGNYEGARKAFLDICKSSPTAQTWLGAGIAFYNLNQFKEAEFALVEANHINNRIPEIWAYLCMLNMSLQRYETFTQCYTQVVKHCLTDVKLWQMITDLMKTLDYTAPTLSTVLHESVII